MNARKDQSCCRDDAAPDMASPSRLSHAEECRHDCHSGRTLRSGHGYGPKIDIDPPQESDYDADSDSDPPPERCHVKPSHARSPSRYMAPVQTGTTAHVAKGKMACVRCPSTSSIEAAKSSCASDSTEKSFGKIFMDMS